MAGAGAKKRMEENRKHMAMLRIWLAAGFTVFFFARLIIRGSSATTMLWVGFVVTSIINAICYNAINNVAKPIYGERGELLDGGNDMSMGGVNSYLHDMLYVTTTVQVGAAFWDKFWYVYLVVPGFVFYQLMVQVVVPWVKRVGSDAQHTGPVMDEATRKKMERTEKRAQKRANKWR